MTISSTTPDPPEEQEARVFIPAESEVVYQSPLVTPAATRRRLGGFSAVSLLLALAGVVAIAGVAFAVGRTTAGNTGTSLPAGAGSDIGDGTGTVPNFGVPGGRDDGGTDDDANRVTQSRSIRGTVTSVSGDALTVRLADGQTVRVTLGGSTTYHSQASASQDDVATGTGVIVSVAGLGPPGTGTSSELTATDVTIVGG
jgi:hypothetical protein